MNYILVFFRAIRLPNVLLVLCAQLFIIHRLEGSFALNNSNYIDVVLLTALILAYGNFENNILDYELDTGCKKKPPNPFIQLFLGSKWYLLFDIAILLMIHMVHILPYQTMVAVSAYLLLKSYNYYFKKNVLAGNLIVSLLCSLSLLIVSIESWVWNYAIIIFWLTLIRELIKDKEDEKCDREYGYRTLAIVLSTPNLIKILIPMTIVILIYLLIYDILGFYLIPALTVGILLVYYIYRENWTLSSWMIKWLIFIGIISIY